MFMARLRKFVAMTTSLLRKRTSPARCSRPGTSNTKGYPRSSDAHESSRAGRRKNGHDEHHREVHHGVRHAVVLNGVLHEVRRAVHHGGCRAVHRGILRAIHRGILRAIRHELHLQKCRSR